MRELGRGQWDEDFQALVASDPSVTLTHGVSGMEASRRKLSLLTWTFLKSNFHYYFDSSVCTLQDFDSLSQNIHGISMMVSHHFPRK